MGRPWCADIEVVEVARRGVPKPVTFIVPYYENPAFLRQQLAWWGTYPAWLREHITGIVVDDGSPEPAEFPGHQPFSMRLFRIEVDRRWNWLAARNIGAHRAHTVGDGETFRVVNPEGWCLLTDIDHVIPASTAAAVVQGAHDPRVIYGFSRIEHDGEVLTPHPNSWFLTREMFWRVGGYDERLSGHYGTDGSWRRRCAATAPMAILKDRLIRHEHVGDSSTQRYLRKQPEDARVGQLLASFPKGSRPKTLSFPYHEVTAAAGVAVGG